MIPNIAFDIERNEAHRSPPLFWGCLAATKRLHSHVIDGRRVEVKDVRLVYHDRSGYLWAAKTSHGPLWVELVGGLGGTWRTMKRRPRKEKPRLEPRACTRRCAKPRQGQHRPG